MENVQGKIFGAAIATLIAILSGLGVGSGGLLVIWLTLALGVDAQMARGLNLLFFVFSAGTALIVHAIKGRIKPTLALFLSLFACLGTLAGTYIGLRVDAYWLKKIFGVMLTVSGSYALLGMLGGRKRAAVPVKNKDIYIK
jgi:uncharacterized membrane protein YfcA